MREVNSWYEGFKGLNNRCWTHRELDQTSLNWAPKNNAIFATPFGTRCFAGLRKM